jgi:hypothetical protein
VARNVCVGMTRCVGTAPEYAVNASLNVYRVEQGSHSQVGHDNNVGLNERPEGRNKRILPSCQNVCELVSSIGTPGHAFAQKGVNMEALVEAGRWPPVPTRGNVSSDMPLAGRAHAMVPRC